MTSNEFKQRYCQRSAISEDLFNRRLVALPCHCDAENCQGWAAVENDPEAIERHRELYGQEEA